MDLTQEGQGGPRSGDLPTGHLCLQPCGAKAPDPEQGFFLEFCVPEEGPRLLISGLVEATLAVTSNK